MPKARSNYTCLAVITIDFIPTKRWKLLSASVFEIMEIHSKRSDKTY